MMCPDCGADLRGRICLDCLDREPDTIIITANPTTRIVLPGGIIR